MLVPRKTTGSLFFFMRVIVCLKKKTKKTLEPQNTRAEVLLDLQKVVYVPKKTKKTKPQPKRRRTRKKPHKCTHTATCSSVCNRKSNDKRPALILADSFPLVFAKEQICIKQLLEGFDAQRERLVLQRRGGQTGGNFAGFTPRLRTLLHRSRSLSPRH